MECILEEGLKEQLLMKPLTDNYSVSYRNREKKEVTQLFRYEKMSLLQFADGR